MPIYVCSLKRVKPSWNFTVAVWHINTSYIILTCQCIGCMCQHCNIVNDITLNWTQNVLSDGRQHIRCNSLTRWLRLSGLTSHYAPVNQSSLVQVVAWHLLVQCQWVLTYNVLSMNPPKHGPSNYEIEIFTFRRTHWKLRLSWCQIHRHWLLQGYDNQRCYRWWQSWHHDAFEFSVLI